MNERVWIWEKRHFPCAPVQLCVQAASWLDQRNMTAVIRKHEIPYRAEQELKPQHSVAGGGALVTFAKIRLVSECSVAAIKFTGEKRKCGSWNQDRIFDWRCETPLWLKMQHWHNVLSNHRDPMSFGWASTFGNKVTFKKLSSYLGVCFLYQTSHTLISSTCTSEWVQLSRCDVRNAIFSPLQISRLLRGCARGFAVIRIWWQRRLCTLCILMNLNANA